jgi:predicted nucleic acid-binding protein
VIVVDASAALAALLNDSQARQLMVDAHLHAPHLIDPEVASALRRRVAAGAMDGAAGWARLDTWRRLGITRYPMTGLLERVWDLRGNVSAYDATYVALAEGLDCPLLTADGRLGRAPGVRCPVTVVRG